MVYLLEFLRQKYAIQLQLKKYISVIAAINDFLSSAFYSVSVSDMKTKLDIIALYKVRIYFEQNLNLCCNLAYTSVSFLKR